MYCTNACRQRAYRWRRQARGWAGFGDADTPNPDTTNPDTGETDTNSNAGYPGYTDTGDFGSTGYAGDRGNTPNSCHSGNTGNTGGASSTGNISYTRGRTRERSHAMRRSDDFTAAMADSMGRQLTLCGSFARRATRPKWAHTRFVPEVPWSCRTCIGLLEPAHDHGGGNGPPPGG